MRIIVTGDKFSVSEFTFYSFFLLNISFFFYVASTWIIYILIVFILLIFI